MAIYLDGDGMMMTEASLSGLAICVRKDGQPVYVFRYVIFVEPHASYVLSGLVNTGIVNKEVDRGEEAVHSSPTTVFGSIWLGNTGCVNDDAGYCVAGMGEEVSNGVQINIEPVNRASAPAAIWVHATGGNEVTLSSSLGKRDHAASCVPMHVVNINIHIAEYNGHGEVNVDMNETTQNVHIVMLESGHNGKNGRGELLGTMNLTTHGFYFLIFQQASPKMCAKVMEISYECYLEDFVEINYILHV
ncbi:hypothetical protein Tco_1567726 [Tanacetum coccineum]